MYGSRGKQQAHALIAEVSGLFAGGDIAEEDMDEMMKAIQDAYWIAKENNRKYTPKKYSDKKKKEERWKICFMCPNNSTHILRYYAM